MEGNKQKKSIKFIDFDDIIEEISNLDLTSKREKTLGTKKGTPTKKTTKLVGIKRNSEDFEDPENNKKHKSSSIKRKIYKRKSRKLLKSLKKRSKSRVRKFKNKSKNKKRSITKKFR